MMSLYGRSTRRSLSTAVKMTTVLSVLLLMVAGLAGSAAAAREAEVLSCARIPELARTYLHKHISFHYINDEVRERVVDTYAKRLDSSKNLYRAEEIAGLKLRLKGVMQDVREGDCSALTDIHQDLIVRYKGMEDFVRSVLEDEAYALDESAILIIDPEKRSYPTTLEAQNALTTKLVHFQMSNYLSSDMELPEAKEKLIHRYELMTKRMKEQSTEDIYSSYLDAFASALDPHSNYLSKEVLEDFQISMELSLEGIGVALSSRDGYSVVEKIIPGGAADRLRVLEPNDKIIAVAQEEGETVDIIDMDLRDVVRLIRGKRGTTVKLTILRQTDTSERFLVSIERDKINLEEQAAKLRIETVDIAGKPTKLAVLELPSFYGGGNPGERQSSRDMEELLKQAREEGAKGLLLDLSRNGGGLLENSVDIAGYFINDGGVVAVKDTFSKIQVLQDRDPGIAFDGPMVVLTSRVSASASEIVAGAMKDYGRAVIVGDDHTFGKGTVQSMVPLPEGLGALKVTTALFFRPGGESTQHSGVASDIIVPSIFGTDDLGEKYQTYSLPSQTIVPFLDLASRPGNGKEGEAAPWPALTPELLSELALRSKARIAVSEDFAEIEERIAKTQERNGVVHLADLLKEREEENAKKDAEKAAEEREGEKAEGASEAGIEGATGEAAAESGTEATETQEATGAAKPAAEAAAEAAHAADDSESEEPSPQQAEALHILADLVELLS